MVRDSSKSRWPEVRELIKMNWDLIDDEEIDSLKGRLDLLSEKIQKVYDCSKERADREMLDFKRELNPKKAPVFYS
jgi:uncharacterized protein YjbJ (UPF0337 family)